MAFFVLELLGVGYYKAECYFGHCTSMLFFVFLHLQVRFCLRRKGKGKSRALFCFFSKFYGGLMGDHAFYRTHERGLFLFVANGWVFEYCRRASFYLAHLFFFYLFYNGCRRYYTYSCTVL